MTSDERIDKLAESVQDLERVMQQKFAALTKPQSYPRYETEQAFQRLDASMARLKKLGGK